MKTITYDPATHVLVPKEPTEEMLNADFMMYTVSSGLNYSANRKNMWRAMLAAAHEVEPQQQGVLSRDQVIALAKARFGWAAGLGGFDDAVIDFAAAILGATPAPAVDAHVIGHLYVRPTPAVGNVLSFDASKAAYDLAPGQYALHVIPVEK